MFLMAPIDSSCKVKTLISTSQLRTRGATLVEMALLASLISVAAVTSLSELGHSIKCQLATIGQRVGTDAASAAPENQPLLDECKLVTSAPPGPPEGTAG